VNRQQSAANSLLWNIFSPGSPVLNSEFFFNTSYIVAVRLENQTIADEKSVSVLLATVEFLLFGGIHR
jgi:hypothetical protein